MPRNNTPILLATLGLGLLAVLGAAFMFLRPQPAPDVAVAQAAPTPTPVPELRWVAARDIPPRTIVTTAMLRRTALTGETPADAISGPDDLRGQITSEEIRAGETVTRASFSPRVRRIVPANIEIPSGYRAVAIWVDPEQTAAGLVDVGDRVDVIATHRLAQEKGKNQQVSGAINFTAGRLIGRNLRVLAVNKSLEAPVPTPTPAPGANGAPAAPVVEGDPAVPPTPAPAPTPVAPTSIASIARTRVLLAATPDIAMRLTAANDQGVLHIAIRNPLDSDADQQPGVKEYPSQLVPDYWAVRAELKQEQDAARNASNAGGGGGGGSRPSAALREPSIPLPIISSAQPQPLPPASVSSQPMQPMTPPDSFPSAASGPIAPRTNEVTVIRGTEKTRVIVPIR